MFGAKEVLAHPWFGRLRRKDVLERRLQPPIRIDDVDSLQFDFGNVKESDYSFLTRVQRQQDSDMQLFRKVMGASFYYDHSACALTQGDPGRRATARTGSPSPQS